jgi:hypothetical protein
MQLQLKPFNGERNHETTAMTVSHETKDTITG